MDSRQDVTLNLANLLKRDVATGDEVEASGQFMPSQEVLDADGLRLTEPLSWELSIRATGEDEFLVMGGVSGTALQECRRCLTDVETDLRAELIYPMEYRPSVAELTLVEVGEEDEELLVFGKPEVDFAELLTQVFAIDLPLTALCQDACKGLSLDGVNLNEHPEHEQQQDDRTTRSPFAALKDLDL